MKIKKQGSSETICETTFCFKDYIHHLPQHKKDVNAEFLIYFIGFFEGDGSLLINHKRQSVEFTLHQHSKDIAFLHKLRTTLGYGKIFSAHTRDLSTFFISNRQNLLRIIHLLNGNICSNHRRQQFKLFLNVYNKK